jgi:hypothetical protein
LLADFLVTFVLLIVFSIAGTALSKATRFKKLLRPFVKRKVSIEVWGVPIPDLSRPVFEIDSISALGAGLLIHLRTNSGGPRVLLKIAEPVSTTIHEGHIEISDARYVSFAGMKLKRIPGSNAVDFIVSPPRKP